MSCRAFRFVVATTAALAMLSACEGRRSRDRGIARDSSGTVQRRSDAGGAAKRPSLEEQLRRFRADIPDTPSVLSGGANSRDALVRRFVRAVERSDTAALHKMVITRGEYAYLVYPSSPLTKPPYNQPVSLAWFMANRESDPGLRRLMDRVGGRPLRYLGYACDPTPLVEGTNRFWRNCRVRRAATPGDTVVARLFGVIVEREGRFKFASYENDF